MEIVERSVETTRFKFVVDNEWERYRVDSIETKEPETVRWLFDNFGPGDTLLDVGANIGIYSILGAVRNPAGRVVAVEPMAFNFARLCQNMSVNELTNVQPYCVAMADRNGLGQLNHASFLTGSSMHSLDSPRMTEEFSGHVVISTGIGVVTADALAKTAGMPNLIKIDVDGGEDAVLAGAEEVLRDPRLRSVLVEFNCVEGSPDTEVRATPLLRNGFVLQSTGAESQRGGVTWRNLIYQRF